MTPSPMRARSQRLSAIDALRGLSLIGMFIYHLTWDLGYFRLISPDIPFTPFMMGLGHVVAASFLALSGASLALSWQRGFHFSHFTRRFGAIVLAAGAITALTAWQFPDAVIFYGILHCIAVASIVCLALRRAPLWFVLIIAAAMFVAPFFVVLPMFDDPAWWWLGLGTRDPPSLDWRPFMPWTGFALIGFALMCHWLARGLPQGLITWREGNAASRLLVLGGRHSLLVYLTHQPIFIVLVFMAAQILVAPNARLIAQDPFLSSCTKQCMVSGGNEMQCSVVCSCIGKKIQTERPIWERALRNELSADDKGTIDDYTRQCLKVQP